MRKKHLSVLLALLWVLMSPMAHAQTVNAVSALGKLQASGCNGKNGYVVLWASSMMWAPKGSNANVVSNPIGVLQVAGQDCMDQGYVPTGGITYVASDPAYYYQPMVLKSPQSSPAAPMATPTQAASGPAAH